MYFIDESIIRQFVDAFFEIGNIFLKKYRFFRYFLIDASIYSSSNYGIVITDESEKNAKYSIYCTSKGRYIYKDIGDNINVIFYLESFEIKKILENKDEYLLKPQKMLKLIPKFLKSMLICEEEFRKEILAGNLVNLRPGNEADIKYLLKWYNDIELNKLAGWSDTKVKASKLRFNMSMSFGYDPLNLIIEDKYKKPIGTIQLYNIDESNKCCKLGIRIGDRDYWGKSYGKDAIITILEYAFTNLGMNRVTLKVYEYNERAYKCYIKCGFKKEGITRHSAYIDGNYYDEVLMGILKSEYLEMKTDS